MGDASCWERGRKPASSDLIGVLCELGYATNLSKTQPPVGKVKSSGPLSGCVGNFSDGVTLLESAQCMLVSHPHPPFS